MKSVLFTVVIVLVVMHAHAQLRKCTAPDGKVTYSDVVCDSGSATGSIKNPNGNTLPPPVNSNFSSATNTSSSRNCSLLTTRAQEAFDRYKEVRNVNSSNASFQSLQNLAQHCPSAKTCGLIRSRAEDAQRRHDQENNRNTAFALDTSLALLADNCRR